MSFSSANVPIARDTWAPKSPPPQPLRPSSSLAYGIISPSAGTASSTLPTGTISKPKFPAYVPRTATKLASVLPAAANAGPSFQPGGQPSGSTAPPSQPAGIANGVQGQGHGEGKEQRRGDAQGRSADT
ncbi:uncharacterized protein MKK02DRAFT_29515 [Dioszegia hungarica]|uniref:Uncharacterized protein n=1 Tax=Dioszegia hungarica TaxID=4972 RepID=A0AA38HFU0_9TREE|nr:uncharacterized protein MKK02DRAFT_29515 [Dioszegia hungarica]KAI9639457.1 hypothetical protein MKK02DRAFT_29515 [Dioszegia hungarica]